MVNDLISRQAAIDALGEEPPVWYDGDDEIAERNQWRRDVKAIKNLPSVQPEIIRCKDCKYCEETNHVFGWCDGRKVWEDHYCGYAERRTDEAD